MKKISRILFALLLASTVGNAVAAETQKGDVNGDNKVTIADVTALVNIILGKDNKEPYVYDHVAADVNGDTVISIADVTTLVNIILGKTPPGSDVVDIDDDDPAWEPANARSNDSSNKEDSADRKIWKD